MAKSSHRIFIENLLEDNKYDSWGDRTIARYLIENEKSFKGKTLENVRAMVRSVRGHKGEVDRKEATVKKHFKPINHDVNKASAYHQNPKEYKIAQKRKLAKSKFYLITWAQNNTPVHSELWKNIKAYSGFLNAEIHVILGRYKNPTSVFQGQGVEHWSDEILDYSDAKRHKIHKHLELLSDIKIQPTATNPLSSMTGISKGNHAILGHPKVAMNVTPALEGYQPKIMMTTGAVTKDNYTDSKAGKKGEFHHTYGFVIVEIKDEEVFFMRQVTALTNGSFTDLIFNVKNEEVKEVKGIEAAILGDIHVGDDDKQVNKQQRVWLDFLKPKHTIIHDIFNGHSISHHEEKDPIKQYRRHVDGSSNLQKEIDGMYEWVESMLKYNLVFVSSNHNDWIDRYVKSRDWKKDIQNAATYVKLANISLNGWAKDGLIAFLLADQFGDRIKVLGRSDSFRKKEWELSQHFDIGVNGSKGSAGQFRKLSTKMVGGHSHVPFRIDGVLYVGTSTKLRVGYNVGASGWANADVIIHDDGKAQHIIYMGDKREFTTLKLK